jgi:hypothetical protein
MQWILQQFEDTQKLADALDRLDISYSWHKVVPFVGELVPEPEVRDARAVVMFGSYALWRYAEAKGLYPGVFRIGECLKLCVSDRVHAVFRYVQASKRPVNIMAS